MRHVAVGLSSLCLLAAWPVAAQPRGYGYVFGAPGGTAPDRAATVHFGAGGERLIYKGIGAGADIGYLTPTRDWGAVLGVLSVNGSYHFTPQDRKLIPFVPAGYSLFFRSGKVDLFNFVGGVQYWMKDHLGLRAEFRDHVQPNPNQHFWEFRFGLSFR